METKVNLMATPTIRFATSEDVSLLIHLGRQTFHDTFASMNTPSDMDLYLQKNFNREQIQSEILDGENIFLVAEGLGAAVGYAKLRKNSTPKELSGEKAIELERLYVAKEYIGQNVGKMLMGKCISIAQQHGFTTIWLGVWEKNDRAIAFYTKFGFEKFSAHPFMLGTDLQTDDMMKKDI